MLYRSLAVVIPCHVSIFSGGAIIKPPEQLCIIAWAVEPARDGDLGDRAGWVLYKQRRALHDPILQKILQRRGLDRPLKAAQTFSFADVCRSGNVRQCDIAGIIILDE